MSSAIAIVGSTPSRDNFRQNIERFCQAGKQQVSTFPKARWADPKWNIAGATATARSHAHPMHILDFSEFLTPSKDVEAAHGSHFADVVKASVVRRQFSRGVSPTHQYNFVKALRELLAVSPLPVRNDFCKLTRACFVSAEANLRSNYGPSTAYSLAKLLTEFATIVDRHGLTAVPVHFHHQTPRPQPVEDRTSANFHVRSNKLPKFDVLEILAEISRLDELKSNAFDLLRMRGTELLLVAGFRGGELLTMPLNALVREYQFDPDGSIRIDPTSGVQAVRIGLRYWPEKGGDPIVKWIPSVANPLVERAIEDIMRITGPARQMAQWLENHPGEVRLETSDDTELPLAEVRRILNLSARGTRWQKNLGVDELIRRPHSNRASILASDLKQALAKFRFDNPVIVRDDGKAQSLSESLFVVFRNDSHMNHPADQLISLPVKLSHLRDFLSAPPRASSVFSRYNHSRKGDPRLRLRTHDPRRLLNTIAQRGGMSQAEIARWMGRTHIADNAAYDYRDAKELAAQYRDLLNDNQVYGVLAEQLKLLPVADRTAFLDACLRMTHHTSAGACSSNIAEMPCSLGLSCLSGCRYYMRRKNEPRSRAALLDLRQHTEKALARAEDGEREGYFNAESWTVFQRTILKNVAAALAIDDDPSIADGALTAIAPQGPDLGDPYVERL